jgi:hypothetical protein
LIALKQRIINRHAPEPRSGSETGQGFPVNRGDEQATEVTDYH